MNYLTYLKIHHFKSIEDLELKDLSNINIIVGDNNSGKTSLLEAISILGNENSIKSILNNVSKRSSAYPSSFELFLGIFPREQDKNKSIKIKSTIKGLTREININGNIVRDISINNDMDNAFLGNINVKLEDETVIDKDISIEESKNIKYINDYDIIKIVYITPYDYYINDLIEDTLENLEDKDKKNIISLLKIFDSDILDFKIVKKLNVGRSMIYIEHKVYGTVPLFSFGDSIKKIFTLGSALVSSKGGILLVDEIESAVHKNHINKMFDIIIKLCKEYKIQLICTTHSLEAIDSIILSLGNEIDSLSCFRIELYDNKTYYTKFSGNKLKDIRNLLGQDVR
ncbi:AAA family ATPase [Romboutsia sp. 13368]|uniref:AAA family ATPase n=1 Tax=Romboutsia sp. 13368 TaxID=2708053 RepID=UPI0025F44A5F|nr:AAA family ATPase [Romboutsia sp. 13368]